MNYGTGAGTINLWCLPAALLRLLVAGSRSFVRLARALRQRPYAAVIVDSNYNLAVRVLFRGAMISLNNSDRIFAHRHLLADARFGTRLHFWLVEAVDYLYQRLIPDLVLSPWPVREPRPRGVTGIGLIVRSSVEPLEGSPGSILVMGSGLGRIDVQELEGFKVHSFGLPGCSQSYDTLPALRRADAAIINAGFSALSEALVHRKRILALPLGNHAEQHIVCGFLKARGWIQTLDDRPLPQALAHLLREANPLSGAALERDGARQACAGILKAAGLAPLASERPYRDSATKGRAPLIPDRQPALDAQ